MKAKVQNPPPSYPKNPELEAATSFGDADFLHIFVESRTQFDDILPDALACARQNALLWLSYPKSSGKLNCDVNRDSLWDMLIPLGWHPVSQVSLDERWSAMRLKPNDTDTAYIRPAAKKAVDQKKYELKTKPTDTDPLQVIAAVPSEKKQSDAKLLLEIFHRATGLPPVVWGERLIGYGCYRYQRSDGHCYEIYATGFSVRKDKITLHLYLDEPVLQEYLRLLGKHTSGKSCVYLNKLADVDTAVLEKMLYAAWNFECGYLQHKDE